MRLRARSDRTVRCCPLRAGSLTGDRGQAAEVSRAAQPAGGVKVETMLVQAAYPLTHQPPGSLGDLSVPGVFGGSGRQTALD